MKTSQACLFIGRGEPTRRGGGGVKGGLRGGGLRVHPATLLHVGFPLNAHKLFILYIECVMTVYTHDHFENSPPHTHTHTHTCL